MARRAPRRPGLHRRAGHLPQPPRRATSPGRRPGRATRSRTGSAPRSVPTSTAGSAPGDPARRRPARVARRPAHAPPQRSVRGDVRGGRVLAVAVAGVPVDDCIAAGLSVVPPGSRYAAAVRRGSGLGSSDASLDEAARRARTRSSATCTGCTSLNNAALVAFALTRSAGDFAAASPASVAGGWDTDSNGATVGSICGALTGASNLPGDWIGAAAQPSPHQHPRLRRHHVRRARRPHRCRRDCRDHDGRRPPCFTPARSTCRPRSHSMVRSTPKQPTPPRSSPHRTIRRTGPVAGAAHRLARRRTSADAVRRRRLRPDRRRSGRVGASASRWCGCGTSVSSTIDRSASTSMRFLDGDGRLRRVRRRRAVAGLPDHRHRRARPVRLLPRRTGHRPRSCGPSRPAA